MTEVAEDIPAEGDEVEAMVEIEVVNGVEIVGKVSHADARGDLPLMRELRDLLFAPIDGIVRVSTLWQLTPWPC